MFSLYKYGSPSIYKRKLLEQLKKLTNHGEDLQTYGSAMLEALCDPYQPMKSAYVIRRGVCGDIVAWGATIQDHSNLSGHVFVHKDFRGQGLAKQILSEMCSNNKLIFYPISLSGDQLFTKYSSNSKISRFYIKNQVLSHNNV